VKLLDGTIKTLLIDLTLPVSDLVTYIGDKIYIANAEEYSLQVEGYSYYIFEANPTNDCSQAKLSGYKRIRL
jgi:hypothetical protein